MTTRQFFIFGLINKSLHFRLEHSQFASHVCRPRLRSVRITGLWKGESVVVDKEKGLHLGPQVNFLVKHWKHRIFMPLPRPKAEFLNHSKSCHVLAVPLPYSFLLLPQLVLFLHCLRSHAVSILPSLFTRYHLLWNLEVIHPNGSSAFIFQPRIGETHHIWLGLASFCWTALSNECEWMPILWLI